MKNLFILLTFALLAASPANAITAVPAEAPTSPTEFQGCYAEKLYVTLQGVRVYVGCYTNVNGHEDISTPAGLTEYGCDTYCSGPLPRPPGSEQWQGDRLDYHDVVPKIQ